MLDSDPLDELDRLIVSALQVNPRSSWERVGSVLGVSDRTVARRAGRLIDLGALRCVSIVDETRCSLGSTMHISVRTKPGKVVEVAEALAARDDMRYVVTCAGSADIVTEAVVADRAAQHRLLDVDLQAVAGLASTHSQVILRAFKTVGDWRTGLLSEDQCAALKDPAPRAVVTDWHLSADEAAIAAALAGDARARLGSVAEEVGLSEPTVRRRVERLVQSGVLYFRCEVEPRLLGFETEAELRISVPYDRLEEAGETIAAQACTRYVGAAAGRNNLSVEAAFPHHDQMYAFLTTVLPEIGATSTDINLITTAVKRAGLRKRDGLYALSPVSS